jgi:sarcosine/dimethylglycine N-methyltransferase
MGQDFAELAANLARNLLERRCGVLTAVFETSSIK